MVKQAVSGIILLIVIYLIFVKSTQSNTVIQAIGSLFTGAVSTLQGNGTGSSSIAAPSVPGII